MLSTVDVGLTARTDLGDACQSGKMGTFFNSIFVVFKLLLLSIVNFRALGQS